MKDKTPLHKLGQMSLVFLKSCQKDSQVLLHKIKFKLIHYLMNHFHSEIKWEYLILKTVKNKEDKEEIHKTSNKVSIQLKKVAIQLIMKSQISLNLTISRDLLIFLIEI